MKKYVSWRRVSTAGQGMSGLGLEAQKDIIEYFANIDGEIVADYAEVYTGTNLDGCTELRRAITQCKEIGATLIIAKSDRFRNVVEALSIYEQMEGRIMFCDLPNTDKFTLTLFFALAEREALITKVRTKSALDAKRKRGEAMGGDVEVWGKKQDHVKNLTESERLEYRQTQIKKAADASGRASNAKALINPHNKAFWFFMQDYLLIVGAEIDIDFSEVAIKLNERGLKTASGLDFDKFRVMAMYTKVKRLYTNKNN